MCYLPYDSSSEWTMLKYELKKTNPTAADKFTDDVEFTEFVESRDYGE